jgi:predicted O-linked N-acetylglucosamine transferase (SPINDLY family)
VQLLWLGCPVTTGTPWYDGFVVDKVVAPPGYEKFCSEPLIRLPHCYHPITHGYLEETIPRLRADTGVDEGKILVGMLQQPNRIRLPFVNMVARTIQSRDNVHLALRAHRDSRQEIVNYLGDFGIVPERIHFIERKESRQEYLGMVKAMDVLVDSFPYGGHSTTGEALSLGRPVIARRGLCIHSRVAASMLHELGLEDMIAENPESHERLLARLLDDHELREAWQERCLQAAQRISNTFNKTLAASLQNAAADLLVSKTSAPLPDHSVANL